MFKLKRPKTIIFFIGLFIWQLLNEVVYLMTPKTSFIYLTFDHFGIDYAYFILSILIIIFMGLSIWFLFKPSILGYKIILTNLGFGLFTQLVLIFLAFYDPQIVGGAYLQARSSQGAPMSESQMEVMTSIYGAPLIGLMGAAFILILIYVIHRKKVYFQSVHKA